MVLLSGVLQIQFFRLLLGRSLRESRGHLAGVWQIRNRIHGPKRRSVELQGDGTVVAVAILLVALVARWRRRARVAGCRDWLCRRRRPRRLAVPAVVQLWMDRGRVCVCFFPTV
ncbi:sodium/solute symporter [Striga asiatica]|uniref:Sodium/solute symporter n=1 Tax=Striga asiatica TaxID=4170 RepID=A0A5A7PAE3_STRAF|nr:sodium/solute symporter [Striga asiatica]